MWLAYFNGGSGGWIYPLQKKPKTPKKGIRLLIIRLGCYQVETYTSMKMVYTTLGFYNPLLLDDQNNELDLSIPSGSALSIATFKITNKPTAKAIGSPNHKATKNYKNNNLFIAHW